MRVAAAVDPEGFAVDLRAVDRFSDAGSRGEDSSVDGGGAVLRVVAAVDPAFFVAGLRVPLAVPALRADVFSSFAPSFPSTAPSEEPVFFAFLFQTREVRLKGPSRTCFFR